MVFRCLLLLVLYLVTCAVAVAEEPVPIEQEPQHRLKYSNQYVRAFDVELPAGYQTLMHWHRADGVFVNISSATTTAQDAGGEVTARAGRAIGETYFIGYGANPKAHRVTNIDSTVYRVTDIEIVKPCSHTASVAEGAHQTLILDNDKVQVTRIILHPGQDALLHGPCGVLVAVSGGRIDIAGTELTFEPAGFRWRESVESLRVVNHGERIFHAVDIRVK